MLLLYPYLRKVYQQIGGVFTFHYASTLSKIKCILTSDSHLFTFHYASTLSADALALERGNNWFTFHYASTLSQLKQKEIQDTNNLHSIMLLLYRHVERRYQNRTWFTFHYASTLSAAFSIVSALSFHLHSIMLLLYHLLLLRRTVKDLHLHSIMLLLYRNTSRSPGPCFHHNLHSIMLLLYLFPVANKIYW